jgi:hypothetical protein
MILCPNCVDVSQVETPHTQTKAKIAQGKSQGLPMKIPWLMSHGVLAVHQSSLSRGRQKHSKNMLVDWSEDDVRDGEPSLHRI